MMLMALVAVAVPVPLDAQRTRLDAARLEQARLDAARLEQARLVAEAEAFRTQLLDAFTRGDRGAVAGMVRYRLVVDAGGLQVPVVDRATLIKMWNVVFPPEVRCLIEESRIPVPGAPAPRHVIAVDAGGVFFGDGRIRADRGPGGLKITRMTLPPGFGEGAAGKPKPVLFRWGKGRVRYAGRLSADNVDVYLVQARKGDVLNAQLQRARLHSASVRVVQQAGNRELPAGSAGQSPRRFWAGVLPENGEYRVEVVRLGAYCDPPASYQLTVSLE
jgi:hypothetical protein